MNIELRNAKKDYYSLKIAGQKHNPKQIWNNLLGKHNKQTVVNELDIEGEILTNPQDIAEGFNDYFLKIGQNLASKIGTSNCNFENYIKKTKSEFAALQPTTISNVCHLLSGLSSNKATGIDKISCKIIQIAAPVIADSLTYIIARNLRHLSPQSKQL